MPVINFNRHFTLQKEKKVALIQKVFFIGLMKIFLRLPRLSTFRNEYLQERKILYDQDKKQLQPLIVFLKQLHHRVQFFQSGFTEVVAWRYSVKKMFLNILQNSQENTCARVSFLIKLQTSGFDSESTFWIQKVLFKKNNQLRKPVCAFY